MKISIFSLALLLFASGSLAQASVRIATTSVPNGTINTTYSAAISATNSCAPYVWSIVSGALPAGITKKVSASTTSLDLAGTPTSAGSDSFTVEVKGCRGSAAKATYTIVIQPTANHVVDLQWKPSTSSDVTGYNVYRSPDGVTWKRSNVSVIGSTFFGDSTVANGSTYYYAATTVDIYGHESGRSASIKIYVP